VAVLRIHAPVLGRQERVFEWDGRPITVGRDDACDVVLLEQAASRRHARLEREGDEIRVFDCDSANGVFVGDERVEGSRVLHDGEAVRIGETTLTLVLDPHRQPTLIRAAVEEPREDIGSGPTLAAPASASDLAPITPLAAEPAAPAPAAPPVVEAPSPPPRVAGPPPGPVPAASSPSAYSLGSEATLAAESGPNLLGIHDRSAPSVYSLGEAPTLTPHAEPSGRPLASSSSVYSLGREPVGSSHEPEVFGSPLPSTASTYSLGREPVGPARELEVFVPAPSTASVYSLGDAAVSEFRGPDLLPPAPAFDGAVSSVELAAPPPRPGGALPLPPPPTPAEPPPRPPAFVVPAQTRSAGSSWGEWSEPAPAHHRPRHHAAGPTLWLGLGLLIGGVVAMIVGLAAGYAPSDLGSLFDTSVVLGGAR
jgi:hypothetical protein